MMANFITVGWLILRRHLLLIFCWTSFNIEFSLIVRELIFQFIDLLGTFLIFNLIIVYQLVKLLSFFISLNSAWSIIKVVSCWLGRGAKLFRSTIGIIVLIMTRIETSTEFCSFNFRVQIT
jgi:hypothetical protein